MTLAEKIRTDLPYLRRYARALTGSQNAGDSYVRATLEAILFAPSEFDEVPSPKVGIYRVFHRIWETSYTNVKNSEPFNSKFDSDNIRANTITPLSRQALLLSALEGFDANAIALITGCSSHRIDGLLAEALHDLDNEPQTSVLIIEDEPLISMELEYIVFDSGHEISGTAATHKDAVAAAMNSQPGLVLADVQLADGSSGIAAVKEILESISVPIIFITAFPERLLTGEQIEPTFLITKPFHPHAVRAAISQALFFKLSGI